MLRPNLTIDGQSIVKIGMTTRTVQSRVKQLGTGSPVRFEVAYSIEAEDARALEKALHRRFASRQIREGGGTEYFRASVQEVVAAIESIATQVSAKRASQAFAADLLEYKKLIGAYVVEQRIDRASMLATILLWAALGWSLWAVWGPLTLLVTFLFGHIVAAAASFKLHEFLRNRIVEPRFGVQLAQKITALRQQYPLA